MNKTGVPFSSNNSPGYSSKLVVICHMLYLFSKVMSPKYCYFFFPFYLNLEQLLLLHKVWHKFEALWWLSQIWIEFCHDKLENAVREVYIQTFIGGLHCPQTPSCITQCLWECKNKVLLNWKHSALFECIWPCPFSKIRPDNDFTYKHFSF